MSTPLEIEGRLNGPVTIDQTPEGRLSVEELRRAVEADDIDTVVLATPDMQGRLQGKRLDARHFVTEVLAGGSHACSYLVGTDIEMDIIGGLEVAGWETGLGNFELAPDLAYLRRLPWMPGTALAIADPIWEDGRAVAQGPREILRAQLARLAERGWHPLVATELEFLLFEDTYRAAHDKRYHELRSATAFDIDYSIQGTAAFEPLMRQIRRGMRGAGMEVEALKGECNLGQFELGFKYADAMTTCDNHVLFKTGAKEIAAQQGVSLTFMAKFNEREGNSCHVHLSLLDEGGASVFEHPEGVGFSRTFERFLAGQLHAARELSLLMAPNVNSYKRFQDGSFAPSTLRWARDNRTCALRVLGHGAGLRLENRIPGGDVNPYLAVATVIAAGLDGIERELDLPPEVVGNAYGGAGERMPTSLEEAVELWEGSEVAARAFGPDLVRHYATAARHEVTAFKGAVTDWERVRGFERM